MSCLKFIKMQNFMKNQNNLENVEEHITVMQLANVSVQFMQIRRSIW